MPSFNFIDLRTLLICVTIIQIFLFFMMVLYWKFRQVYGGFIFWAFHLFFIGLGNIGMILRGLIPDFLSIFFSSIATTMGLLFLYDAISHFYKNSSINRIWYLILIPTFTMLWYFTYIAESFAYRSIFLAFILTGILIPIMLIFFKNTLPIGKQISRIMGFIYFILTVILLTRGIDFIFTPEGRSLYEISPISNILFLYTLFNTIIATFIFFLLNFDRMAYDLEQVHNQVKKLGARYDLAIKAARAGVWEIDIKTGLLIADEQIYRLAGKTPPPEGVLKPLDLKDVIHPEDLPNIMKKVGDISKDDEELTVEYRVTRPNGEIRYNYSHAKSFFDENGELKLVGLATDITPLKRAQNAIKEAMKKISILSSITRHDILNSVSVISMTSEILLKDIINPEHKNRISAIYESSKVITELIKFTGEYQKLGVQDPKWIDIVPILMRAKLFPLVKSIDFFFLTLVFVFMSIRCSRKLSTI